jgi:hypothetical protein
MNQASRPLSPFLTASLLSLILVLGVFPRFHRLEQAGPFVSDECDYFLEAQYLYTGISALSKSFWLFVEERRTGEDLWNRQKQFAFIKENTLGRSPWRGRVGHNYLLALGMALGRTDASVGNYLSAVFGVLTLLVVFLLGRALYDARVGLLASALVALSGYHVLYSRSALLEIDLYFFLLLAALFYVNSRRPGTRYPLLWVSLSSIALGASFLIVFRTLVPLFVFWAFEVHLAFSRRGKAENPWPARLLALALPMFFVILLTEVPYYLAFLACQILAVVPPFMTYLEQVVTCILIHGGYGLASTMHVFSFANLLSFPYLFWKINGPLTTLALAAGLAYALWKHSWSDLFVAALCLFPLFVYTLAQPRARYGGFAVCTGLLLVARLLVALMEVPRGGKVRFLGIVVTVLLLAEGLWFSLKAVQEPAGYRQAMQFMAANKGIRHISSYPSASAAYGGSQHVFPGWPESESQLYALYREGYNYVLTDFLEVFVKRFFSLVPEEGKRQRLERSMEVFNRVRETVSPVFVCPNPPVEYLNTVFEVNHNFNMSLELYEQVHEQVERVGYIQVYDLEDYFRKRPFTAEPDATEAPSPRSTQ